VVLAYVFGILFYSCSSFNNLDDLMCGVGFFAVLTVCYMKTFIYDKIAEIRWSEDENRDADRTQSISKTICRLPGEKGDSRRLAWRIPEMGAIFSRFL
jgi:hypothetical protein